MEFEVNEYVETADRRSSALDGGLRRLLVTTDGDEPIVTVWVGNNGKETTLAELIETAYDNL